MQIALTLILALLAIAALATAMRAIVIARAAAWMDMVAIGATDSCESAGYVGCSVVCTGVDNMQQIESLLDVEYDRYETIVVLDARAAGITFRAIVARYDLIRVDADPSDEFPSARIRSLFRSRTRSMRRLTLVDRAAASPYDDLDAGASVASYDYILPVGRDTYLMPNAIEKAVIAIASTPDTPIAALHSVSDDQCYVFNRETLIAQGGFSPHLLNSIRSGEVRRTFAYELADLEPNRIERIHTPVVHPDNTSGTMFITPQAYAEGSHGQILQDGEPKTIYTDPAQRRFNTAAPLQLSVTDAGELHARFYSPRPLSGVLVRARIPRVDSEYLDLAWFDSIPPFADFCERLPQLERPTQCLSESGRWVDLPQLTAADFEGVEFAVECEDPYWKKLRQIIHGWTIAFSLFNGDPDRPDGGPSGNWMGIRPVHCREAVAFFLNFTYMIDMPEHEVILRENQDRLYGNGGVNDKVTPERVLSQMRQSRSLNVGLVYPGNGIVGLGGGSSYGAYQQAWLQHYFNTYSCEIMFHELGHVMGYNHSSSFTYGPWAQELMNHFYVNHLDQMPIDSPSYLNSSQNPTLY